jgi:hypothetical protein
MLSIGHKYHWCFIGIRKLEEEFNDGGYLEKNFFLNGNEASSQPQTDMDLTIFMFSSDGFDLQGDQRTHQHPFEIEDDVFSFNYQ